MIYDICTSKYISINYIHWSWRKNSEHMKHNEKSLHCRLSFQKAYMPLNNSAYTRILCTVPKFWNVFFQSPMINTKMNIKRICKQSMKFRSCVFKQKGWYVCNVFVDWILPTYSITAGRIVSNLSELSLSFFYEGFEVEE